MMDASQKSLGAALFQPDILPDGSYGDELKPVAFARKAFTLHDSNLEREMLGILFGIKSFHTFLFVRPITIITDHKLLQMIRTKHINSASTRSQTMLLIIQCYDYQILYAPGKSIALADILNGLPSHMPYQDLQINVRVEQVQFIPNKKNEIRNEISSDPALNMLKEVIYTDYSRVTVMS